MQLFYKCEAKLRFRCSRVKLCRRAVEDLRHARARGIQRFVQKTLEIGTEGFERQDQTDRRDD